MRSQTIYTIGAWELWGEELLLLCLVIIGVILLGVSYFRCRSQLLSVDRMLDKAIAGQLEPDQYDESQISKLEAKTARFLSAAGLKKGQMEGEQVKVHGLISDISHQTKTPIANILLYAQLLEERDGLEPEAKEYIHQIENAAEKLDFLVQSLMKSSRLEHGLIAVHPKPGSMEQLAREAVTACAASAAQKHISLALLPPETEITAMIDRKWCGEALYNLIDNAVKYTPSGGRVTVSLKEYGLFACVQVRDSGKGIAEGDIPKVFGRFCRAADVQEMPGVGLGLYLSREIASACGGYIKVSSGKGEGACFSLFLPKE